jgi:hypothetical protein
MSWTLGLYQLKGNQEKDTVHIVVPVMKGVSEVTPYYSLSSALLSALCVFHRALLSALLFNRALCYYY